MSGLLQFTHCEKCGKDYLVGINGKLIAYANEGGSHNLVSIEIPEEMACKNCGHVCKVEDSAEVER